MKENEIIEGNKLIAEFIADRVDTYHGITWMVDFSGEAIWNNIDSDCWEFHSSWDWLIPVVDKIMDIDITPVPQWTGYRMEIVPRGYVKISGFPMPTITTNVSIEGSLINAVWKAIVSFIHWYNTLNPPPSVAKG